MTEQAQLAELISRFQSGTPEIREAMLRVGSSADKPLPGTIRQAAEIGGCNPRTIQRYATKGLLHPIRISPRRVRYDLREVERLFTAGVDAVGSTRK